MSRWWRRLLLAGLLALPVFAQKTKPQPPVRETEPPEEDESLTPKEYTFNPLQAAKEIRIGNYYFKKGSFRAAARRFEEATKWDPANGDAWLRLGEAREKQKDFAAARDAYQKFLEMTPDAKNAGELRKKTGKWKNATPASPGK